MQPFRLKFFIRIASEYNLLFSSVWFIIEAGIQKEAVMGSKATVTYYHHSGFTVEIGETLMVFDYWRGEKAELPPDKQLTIEKLKAFEKEG